MSDIEAFIIVGVIALIFIGMAIPLLMGKGAFLIAGYNTLSEKEKEKYDQVALCKFMGKILLPIGITCPLIAIGGKYDIPLLIALFFVVTIGLTAFALYYCNTKNRFRK